MCIFHSCAPISRIKPSKNISQQTILFQPYSSSSFCSLQLSLRPEKITSCPTITTNISYILWPNNLPHLLWVTSHYFFLRMVRSSLILISDVVARAYTRDQTDYNLVRFDFESKSDSLGRVHWQRLIRAVAIRLLLTLSLRCQCQWAS